MEQTAAVDPREKLIICVPYGGFMDPRMTDTLFVTALIAEKSGVNIAGITHSWRKVIHTARNELAAEFLEKTDAEWSFWADSDMTFPPNTIIDLYRWAKSLGASWMTGVYFQRYAPHDPVLFRLPPRSQGQTDSRQYYHQHLVHSAGRTKPYEADCAGFGCMLVHRRVFESMKKPYFSWLDEGISEDFYFSVAARKAGFVLYAVPSVECGHIPDAEPVTRSNFEAHRKAEEFIEIKEVYTGAKNGRDSRNPGTEAQGQATEKPDDSGRHQGGNGRDAAGGAF